MVLAYHVVFTTYGFWLPNDPRGSNSSYVRNHSLYEFGPATKVHHRHSVAHVPHNAALRAAAKQSLRYPPVILNGHQALHVAHGFADTVLKSRTIIHACSILPQHIHLVIARHHFRIEQIINLLKGSAAKRLLAAGLHPFQFLKTQHASPPSMWARNSRRVFLNTPEEIIHRIRYVENNPLRDGKKPQRGCSAPFGYGR